MRLKRESKEVKMQKAGPYPDFFFAGGRFTNGFVFISCLFVVVFFFFFFLRGVETTLRNASKIRLY